LTPSRVVDRRGLLGRYVDDAECLRLFEAVMSHEARQPAGAPAFIVEPSVKIDLRDGSRSRNRFSIIVKHPRTAIDITAALFEQGLIAPGFKDEITVFVMRAVLRRGIFAFGMDFSSQRIVKVYTEYEARAGAEPAQGRIDCLVVVDDAVIRAKHYRAIEVEPAWWDRADAMAGLALPRQNVTRVYGVGDGPAFTEHHLVLSQPWRHHAFAEAVTVIALKAHEITWYLRPWREPAPHGTPGPGMPGEPVSGACAAMNKDPHQHP
jgi:hypothetical protein